MGRLYRCIFVSASPACANASLAGAPELVSGKPLMVGANDGVGPLSTGMSTAPLGAAYVFNSAQPDLLAVAGGTGRSKINLVDWDGDGKTDLLVGTPRHGSIPNPTNGLPQSKGLKGSAVVFLKNVGSNDQPVFAFPTLMKFKGAPIYLGQHECGPAAAFFSGDRDPDLLVGTEEGRIIHYRRSDLSWDADAPSEGAK